MGACQPPRALKKTDFFKKTEKFVQTEQKTAVIFGSGILGGKAIFY
jgi:hypothetical protein